MNQKNDDLQSIERFLASRARGTSDEAEKEAGSERGGDAALSRLWDELADVPDSVGYRELLPALAERLEQERSSDLGWFGQGAGRLAAAALLIVGALGGFSIGQPESRTVSAPSIVDGTLNDDFGEWLDVSSATFAELAFGSWQIEGESFDLGLDDSSIFEDTLDPGLESAASSGAEGQDA